MLSIFHNDVSPGCYIIIVVIHDCSNGEQEATLIMQSTVWYNTASTG